MDIREVHQELMQSIPKEAHTQAERGNFLYCAVLKFLNKPARPLNLPLVINLINWGCCSVHTHPSREIRTRRLEDLGYIGLEATTLLLQKNDEWSLSNGWREVIKKLLALILTKAEETESVIIPSESLMNFVLEMMRNTNRCADVALRIKMLFILNIWPKGFLQDADVGKRITATLTSMKIDMACDHYVANKKYSDICFAFVGVVKKLLSYGHLDAVVNTATNQLKALDVGPETRWFLNILEYAYQFICQAVNWSKIYNSVEMNLALKCSILLMKTMFESKVMMEFYKLPGIAFYVARSILQLLECALDMYPKVPFKEGQKCLTDVDHLFDMVTSQKVDGYGVIDVLQQLGANHLKMMMNYCKAMNIELKHVPEPPKNSPGSCPPEFMDSMYLTLMVSPVKLSSSGRVVDEATLLQLLLQSTPTDPFTNKPLSTYTRLPTLKKRIAEWRNNKTH